MRFSQGERPPIDDWNGPTLSLARVNSDEAPHARAVEVALALGLLVDVRPNDSPSPVCNWLKDWLAALDDLRNWLIREAHDH
jgi:hypothetical protein